MPIRLYRIDDRLVHGQVVIGWGRPLGARFIVLVDEQVRRQAWEQELYRMAVPPDIEIIFVDVSEARARLAEWNADPRVGILLAGDIPTMVELRRGKDQIARVNLGGIHHRPGRTERLPYVYLSDEELETLRGLAAAGCTITAQAVPTEEAVPLARLA